MISKPITHTEARQWMRARFANFAIPRGAQVYFVSGIQHMPTRGNLYLAAGENGLEGVYIVKATAQERRAA